MVKPHAAVTVPTAVAARAARLRGWWLSRIHYGRPLAIGTTAAVVSYLSVTVPGTVLLVATAAVVGLVPPVRREVWPALKCAWSPGFARVFLPPACRAACRAGWWAAVDWLTEHPARRAAWLVIRPAVVIGLGYATLSFLFGWLPAFAQPEFWLLAVLAVLALAGEWRPGRKVPARDEWYSPANVNRALTQIGILNKPKPDAKGRNPSMASRWPAGKYDAATGELRLPLPRGRTFSEVGRQWEAFVSALGVPLGLTTLTRCASGLANVIVIRVAAPLTDTVRSHLGTAQVTRWHSPLRIGRDDRGQPVTTQTHEANYLIAGTMGYGKTSAARIFAADALLDPTAHVWIIDGKGSRADWSDAEPAVERLVMGTDDDCVAQTVDVLSAIRAEDRARQAASKGRKGTPGGLVLVLDEWAMVRTRVEGKAGVALDKLLEQVVCSGRASGVVLAVITQRPAVTALPSAVRNLLSHQILLVCRPEDAKLTLGETPTLPLPKRKGEALLGSPAGVRAVQLDYLDEKAWESVCQRSAQLRERTRPAAVVQDPEPVADPSPHTGDPVPEPPEPAQPVGNQPRAAPAQTADQRRLAYVIDQLLDHYPDGGSAEELFSDIGDGLDIPAAQRGRWLGEQRKVGAPICSYRTSTTRLWKLTEAAS